MAEVASASADRAAPSTSTAAAVEDLVVRFRTHGRHGLRGQRRRASSWCAGETLGLVGESGCGKSVTSLAITRLLPEPAGRIENGRVIFGGATCWTLTEDELRDVRGDEIAMIFQDPLTSLNPVLTIGDADDRGHARPRR